MDELELLKKDWQEKGKSIPKLSYDELSKMIWKRSSSIVKWIFYISVFELALVLVLNFIFARDKEYWESTQEANLTGFTIFTYVITFGLIIYFMIRFYKNYKAISSTDDTKTLMENILKTRKTVKNYIKITISFTAVVFIVTIVAMLVNDENFRAQIREATNGEPTTLFWVMFTIVIVISMAIVLVLFWLFYQLIYGLLLRKLNQNYKELERMELQ